MPDQLLNADPLTWLVEKADPSVRYWTLRDILRRPADEQGRWRYGSVSRTWPIEKRNRASKWVTLDALRAIAKAQS